MINEKIILSQSGVYRLQKLANQVHNTTGIRHRLSDQASMLKLIDFSSHCENSLIHTYLAAFASELDAGTLESLENQGILDTRH